VDATKVGTTSPATAVLGEKLAHTGASGSLVGTLFASLVLLILGGLLLAVGERSARRH
jgi:hypothetical protein